MTIKVSIINFYLIINN